MLNGEGELVSWFGDGTSPALFNVQHSTASMTVSDGVVSAQGTSYLTHTMAGDPLDLLAGFSAYVVCRVPDYTTFNASNRLFWMRAGGSSLLNVFFPNAIGRVQVSAGGANAVASGLTQAEMETFAVWGFVHDLGAGQLRILRNGVIKGSTTLAAPLTGLTNYRILSNSFAQSKDAVTFGFSSA